MFASVPQKQYVTPLEHCQEYSATRDKLHGAS